MVRKVQIAARSATVQAALLGLLLAALLGGTLGYWLHVRALGERVAEQRFDRETQRVERALLDRIHLFEALLRAGRGLFDASTVVTRDEWTRFARSVAPSATFPGIDDLSLVRYVPPGGEAAFESLMRHEVDGAFRLHPERPGRERFVRTYIEPAPRDAGSFGYDLASEPLCRAAAEAARDRGAAVVSAPLPGPRGTGEDRDFLHLIPLYRPGAPTGSVEERRAAIYGWVVASYDSERLFRDVVGQSAPLVRLEVRDAAADPAAGTASLFRDAAGDEDARPEAGRIRRERRVAVGGRTWVLSFRSTPMFDAANQSDAPYVLVGGFAFSLAVWWAVMLLVTGRERAVTIAAARTRELRESEERYREMFSANTLVQLLIDPLDGAIVDANAAACEFYGHGRERLRSMRISDINTAPEGELRDAVERVLARRHNHFFFRHRLASGEVRDVEVFACAITAAGRTLLHSSVHDITERVRADDRLRLAQKVFETTSEAIMVTDGHDRITAVNPAFTEITGFSRDEALGEHFLMLDSRRHDEEFFRSMRHEMRRTGRWQGELWIRTKAGELRLGWLSVAEIRGPSGTLRERVSVFSDITERKRAHELIWRQANYDALTNLPNRSLFLERLRQALRVADRTGRLVTLMFIDLDHFKWVNDTRGHSIGDRLLEEASRRIMGVLRRSDTVARLGGDEFTVVLPDTRAIGEVEPIVLKILSELARPIVVDGHETFITASVGVTIYPTDGREIEDLLKHADAAMYRAKESGRNTFRFFTPEMNAEAVERMTLESELRRALERDELRLHYQPIVDLRTGQVTGAEALLRWEHPLRGFVPPDRFIPLAEETGLIAPIGEWVLRTACHQAAMWHAPDRPPLSVSVNLSTRECRHGDYAAIVRRVLDDTRLPPKLLTLEITESLIMENLDHVVALLHELRDMGVRLAIDDFGTGYSSLGYLRTFPIDALKIDRSFVRDVATIRDDAVLVEAILAMARSLRIHVVGEGVESFEQLEFLRAKGCHLAQGYYFSEPLSADRFERFVFERELPHASSE